VVIGKAFAFPRISKRHLTNLELEAWESCGSSEGLLDSSLQHRGGQPTHAMVLGCIVINKLEE
jgi:hypothetical protein